MKEEEVLRDIQKLYKDLSMRDSKYLRNLNRFLSNGNRREDIRKINTTPPAFQNKSTDTTGIVPAINVGRSMVTTLISKLIQTKGRVFFNPTNGQWETIKTCRNAQIFFDQFYETDNTYQKVQKCVQDACIFDIGIMHINHKTKSTEHIHPWQFFLDPAEFNYNKISRCMTAKEEYPLNSLKEEIKDTIYEEMLVEDPYKKVTLYEYYDLIGKKLYTVVNQEIVLTEDLDFNTCPYVFVFYNDAIKGFYSVSLIDNIYSHQRQIDDIAKRMHDAITLSPANTIYVPKSASGTESASAKMMSNKVGNIVPYNASLGVPVVSTPNPIDPSYMGLLQFFQTSAYEQEGISQLSAQSKKPSGISSGVALDTLQDVESERFQAQVDQLIQFYKDINSTMIDVFPATEDILPKRINRANLKWSKIKKQRDSFSMQSSLATALSKDPKIKMEQIEKLQQQGIINPNMAASLLQLPDLEGAYSAATASFDASRKIIERAIDEEIYEFTTYLNLQQLLAEAVNVLLQLIAADEKPVVIDRLNMLIDIIQQKIDEVVNIQNPPVEQIAPEIPPVSDTSLDSGQISSLAEIVDKVTAGTIQIDQARALILSSYPTFTPEIIDAMIGTPPEKIAADNQAKAEQEQAQAAMQEEQAMQDPAMPAEDPAAMQEPAAPVNPDIPAGDPLL